MADLARMLDEFWRESGMGIYIPPRSDSGEMVVAVLTELPSPETYDLVGPLWPAKATVLREARAGKRIRTADMLLGKQPREDDES